MIIEVNKIVMIVNEVLKRIYEYVKDWYIY